jgi:hypothetical protein
MPGDLSLGLDKPSLRGEPAHRFMRRSVLFEAVAD